MRLTATNMKDTKERTLLWWACVYSHNETTDMSTALQYYSSKLCTIH